MKMNSRLSSKPSRKDRPKSSDKAKSITRGGKRDDTPEKPISPSQSQLLEEEPVPPSKRVLDGDDIQALAIQPGQLAKMHSPKPPERSAGADRTKRVAVRKLKPQSELSKRPVKTVLVAKPAPPEAPLQTEDYTDVCGLRFDANGNIIPHSILGTLEDYQQEAAIRGHVTVPAGDLPRSRPQTPRVRPQQVATPTPREKLSAEENRALINWQNKMLDRKRQQGYISKLLQKPVDSLLMNQARDFRQTQEQRHLIDRSIPAQDYGKGYRVGSEFWKQQERIGDDLSGIHMTLTQTERGYAPPIEHVQHPDVIKNEMGLGDCRSSPVHYPWHQSQYLKERRDQLLSVMKQLDPYKPDLEALHVTGSTQPTKASSPSLENSNEDTHAPANSPEHVDNQENIPPASEIQRPASGPCLVFQGFRAGWAGDSFRSKGQVANVTRVTFEGFAGDRVTAHLELANEGTTSLHYDWKKIPRVNPFEAAKSTSRLQRFYFNTSSGVLLPGDRLKFPFIFKSPNAGIFSETWQLDTKPVLCGGAALQVTLRGIAMQEDKTKKERNQIERELYHRQAEVAVRHVLDEIVGGIRTPPRAVSPVDAYITDEERFERENPQLHYSSETVAQINDLRRRLYVTDESDGTEQDIPPWDLSVQRLKEELICVADEDLREDLLNRLNSSIGALSFPPPAPMQEEHYRIGYQLFLEAMDTLDTEAETLRASLGFPERSVVYPQTPDILAANETLRGGPPKEKKLAAIERHSAESPGDPKKKKKDDDKKDKKDGKKSKKDDKDRPKSKQEKNLKAGSKGRETASPRLSKESRTAPKEGRTTPVVRPYPPPSETGDPLLDAKYRNKLYIMVYNLLGETAEKMAGLLEDVQKKQRVV